MIHDVKHCQTMSSFIQFHNISSVTSSHDAHVLHSAAASFGLGAGANACRRWTGARNCWNSSPKSSSPLIPLDPLERAPVSEPGKLQRLWFLWLFLYPTIWIMKSSPEWRLVRGIIPKWLLSAIFRLRNYYNSATKMGLAMWNWGFTMRGSSRYKQKIATWKLLSCRRRQ